MKKISLNLVILTIVLTVVPSTFALSPLRGENRISITPGEFRKEIKKEVKEKIENKGLLDKVKNFLKKNLRFEARIKGKITAKNTNSLTVVGEDSIIYQINIITDKTQLLMKFGGKSKLSEYLKDNEVMVIGKFTDETKTAIDAKVIRNLSIQKRWGAFFGKVTAINSDNFVMDTLERGTQTVYFGSTTKFVKRNEKPMTYTDLKVGDRVRVKGIWDKTLNKINEVTQVKDFSLPVIAPTPTGSV